MRRLVPPTGLPGYILYTVLTYGLASVKSRDLECVELYLHSPVRLHGMVLG